MRTFRCPKCGHVHDEPVAREYWHRCRTVRRMVECKTVTPDRAPDATKPRPAKTGAGVIPVQDRLF